MEKTKLGRTGLEVSVAGLGAGGHSRLGQSAGLSEEHSADVVRAALDLGVTLIDTAAIYGTETIVGKALAGRRDGVVLSTKARMTRGGNFNSLDLVNAAELRESVENSLRLLRTDRIDVLHLHGVRLNQYDHCVNELMPALRAMQAEGKVRFLGITENFGPDHEHATLTRALADGFWDVLMVGYNFVNQSVSRHVLPRAIADNIGILCMFAVRGALANPDKLRNTVLRLIDRGEVDVDAVDRIEALRLKGKYGSLTEAAYRFCRHTPGIGTVLFGTGKIEHLKSNIAAINGPKLDPDTIYRLQAIFGRVVSATGDP